MDLLSGQITQFKEATIKKFDSMLANLENLKMAVKTSEIAYQDVNDNLDQFENMFNKTLSSQKELNHAYKNHVDLSHITTLA